MADERATFSTLDLLPDNLPADAVTEEERERLALRRRLAADPLASRPRPALKGRRRQQHQHQYQHQHQHQHQQRDGTGAHARGSSRAAAPDAGGSTGAAAVGKAAAAEGRGVSSDELVVFGYASTVFSGDDAAAARVERGEFLIPWRNEAMDPIMLDRFDARNLLEDRGSFTKIDLEPAAPSFDDEEERMCDAERYADLDSEEEDLWDMSEDERNLYVEAKWEQRREDEERKAYSERIAAARAQVDYTLQIQIPSDMAIPHTRRHLAIIEKTAKFLNDSLSTTNMEVVIQAKQANNPDFGFLNTHNELHPFYRHVRDLMSSGSYVESSVKENHGGYENSEGKSKERTDGQTDEGKTQDKKSTMQKAEFTGQVPPPDVKTIIDKTAAFVARAGKALEQRLLERNADNPRFNFLNPWCEHHKYWKWALEPGGDQAVPAEDGERAEEKKVGEAGPVL